MTVTLGPKCSCDVAIDSEVKSELMKEESKCYVNVKT